MYWFFDAAVIGTLGAIVVPSTGERLLVMVLSAQLPFT